MDSRPLCRNFSMTGTCRFGETCRFPHRSSTQGSLGDSETRGPSHTTSQTNDNKNNEQLYKWKRLIPRPSNYAPQSFGSDLPQFFQLGLTLVQGELGMLQETIKVFARDEGLLSIRELIDLIPHCRSDSARINLWRDCVRPLFCIITEPKVVRSTILEIQVGTIYNVLLGYNASRLGSLYGFLISLAETWQQPTTQGQDGRKSAFLELCAAVLAKAIDCNTQIIVSKVIPPIVDQLEALVKSLGPESRDFWSLQTQKHLEYIRRRLAVEEVVLTRDSQTQPLTRANFILRRDLPGSLSAEGPRHDNDDEDITKIRILPTMSEIMASRADYRPFHDPAQLHLPGVKGLIDRHFRLLRDDMVGNLKQSIRSELELLDSPDSQPTAKDRKANSLRTYVYSVVDLVDVTCKRRQGLEFALQLKQPFTPSPRSTMTRQEWWGISRRLETGALVCLLEKGTAVFCVVSESTVRPDPSRTAGQETEASARTTKKRNLFSDNDFAYVNLCLAEPQNSDLEFLVRGYKSGLAQRSLVEFPGVVLPSFKPTLCALQHMYTTLDMPFSEIIAPTAEAPEEPNVLPPLYSTKPGFTYSLKCLVSDGGDLVYSPDDVPDPKGLCERSTLDEGQAIALLNTLRRGFQLIVGPPGTGKSYTGEAIIKVLLDNKESGNLPGPILCVCYTNHALDQLLEHLWHGGVKQIIRIGSRSKSSILEDVNLRKVAQNIERTKAEKHESWKHGSELARVEIKIQSCLDQMKTSASAKNIKEFLNDEWSNFHDAIFGVEEEGWFSVNYQDEKSKLNSWINDGGPSEDPPRASHELRGQQPDSLTQAERTTLCHTWAQDLIAEPVAEFISFHEEYNKHKREHERVLREVDVRVLEQADIVGVTTTGLAKNLDLLRKLDTKVILVEEAAELMESHLLTALLPSLEHIIQIGDPDQLRPKTNDYELQAANPLGRQYSLDVSLFERLVKPLRPSDNKLPYDMIQIQRRMDPSISSLIRETIYPALKDAPNVEHYPPVVGMRKRLFWFDHDKPEDASGDPGHPVSTSHTNYHEVEMTCAFVSHLVKQGYLAEEIVVLTPYLGQLIKLRKSLQNLFELVINDRDADDLDMEGLGCAPEISKQRLSRCIRLATVDNFQGEEANVVVVSLVRSNPQGSCGFLNSPNRINVLLSRAKHGMFILGNSATYGRVDMWQKVISLLKDKGNFGTKLPLQCPRHPDTPIEVASLEDFSRLSPEAGCDQICHQHLPCGHECVAHCHSSTLHKAVECKAMCKRSKQCGHICPRKCSETCEEKCSTIVSGASITLPCNHILNSPVCWQIQDPGEAQCQALTEKEMPGCCHMVLVPCHLDLSVNKQICDARCSFRLPCGHSCGYLCWECRVRENGSIVAEFHRPCNSACGKRYNDCNHYCSSPCHPGEDCPPCSLPCEVGCQHSRCQKTCSEPCIPCQEATCAASCSHSQCTMPCAASCNWIPCSKRCRKLLPCSHQCPSICGETCPGTDRCQICASEEVKSTVVDMFEFREYRDIDLDLQPCIYPMCGHFMTVTTMDGLLGMSDHYEISEDGEILGIKPSSNALSETPSKRCPTCQGSLRDIGRYGRLVRRGLLDESTRKFTLWSSEQSRAFERRLIDEQEKLEESTGNVRVLATVGRAGDLHISGSRIDGLFAVYDWVGYDRYKSTLDLHFSIQDYLLRVEAAEQPYQRVFDLVQHACRFGAQTGDNQLYSSRIQTRGCLSAAILLLRCELTILEDFVTLRQKSKTQLTNVTFDLSAAMSECIVLIGVAKEKTYVRQEAEAHILYATFVGLMHQINPFLGSDLLDGLSTLDGPVSEALDHIERAKTLISRYASTAHLQAELDTVELMFLRNAWYSPVTVQEKQAIWLALAGEATEKGHWKTCTLGHPFTVGEGHMPMEDLRCSECDAPVGGEEHEPIKDIAHDDNMDALEVEAQNMRI